MLHVIGGKFTGSILERVLNTDPLAAPGSHTTIDWHETWRGSGEYGKVREHLAGLREYKVSTKEIESDAIIPASGTDEFAMPFFHQLWYWCVTFHGRGCIKRS